MSGRPSCATSIRTWPSSAASMRRRWPSSARASSASGRRCSGRRPRRSVRPARMRPDDFAVTSYREHGVAYCRGVDPVAMLRMWRGSGLSGWDPARYNIATPAIVVGSQALHATGYALGITLDHARLGRADVLRRRRHERRRHLRGPRLRRQLHGAGGLLLPEQPVGHLRAGAPPVPRHHRPARAGLRHPRRAGGRQRRARRAGRHPSRPGAGLRRRGPDAHRGGDLPHGAAHDVGRPDALPLARRGGGVAGQGPAGPPARAPAPRGAGRRGLRTRGHDGGR